MILKNALNEKYLSFLQWNDQWPDRGLFRYDSGRCIEVVSTSHPKGNRAKGKNCAQGRSKKPTLIEGVQYH
jgi:hypothetical protein